MREALRDLYGPRRVFSGYFIAYGTNRRTRRNTALFRDLMYNGRIVADHVWANQVDALRSIRVHPGDLVQFNAEVRAYKRWQFLHGLRCRFIDYCIADIQQPGIIQTGRERQRLARIERLGLQGEEFPHDEVSQ